MAILSSFDPFFRDFDRVSEGMHNRRTPAMPRLMSADAYRRGDRFVVNFDLPGVDPATVEVTVEKNVLSVTAERSWAPEDGDRVVLAERQQGHFERKLFLSDNLDTDRIEANYDRGVLSLQIPVSEQAKPRKVAVTSGDRQDSLVASSSTN